MTGNLAERFLGEILAISSIEVLIGLPMVVVMVAEPMIALVMSAVIERKWIIKITIMMTSPRGGMDLAIDPKIDIEMLTIGGMILLDPMAYLATTMVQFFIDLEEVPCLLTPGKRVLTYESSCGMKKDERDKFMIEKGLIVRMRDLHSRLLNANGNRPNRLESIIKEAQCCNKSSFLF